MHRLRKAVSRKQNIAAAGISDPGHLAKKSYTKNPDSPLGKELDLIQDEVISYVMEHEDNEHWRLAEDNK